MLKEELLKTFKSKKSLLLFCYLLAVAIGDNICGILQTGEMGGYYNAHPAYLSLLSGQSALVFYALYIWVLPITVILLYCGRYNQEYKSHMNYVYTVKVGRKKCFFSKIGCSFIVSVIYFGIPLIINMLISILFLHGGTSLCDMEKWSASEIGDSFLYFCAQHPYAGWLIYFIAALIVFGLAGILSQSVAIISKDNRITLTVSFAIWISLFSIKYDLTMAIQPFTEYGSSYSVKALLILISIVIVALVSAYIIAVVKKDEI